MSQAQVIRALSDIDDQINNAPEGSRFELLALRARLFAKYGSQLSQKDRDKIV